MMLRAKQTFHAFTADGVRTVNAGDELPDDHDLAKGREDLFEHVPDAETPKPKARRKTKAKPDADVDA